MYTISALDYCAIVGISPFDNPLSLFLKKTGKISENKEETYLTKLGKRMKKVHREFLQDEGIFIIFDNPNIRIKKQYPQLISSPDDYANYNGEKVIVEYKTCLHGVINEKFYETQLRWNMFICELNGLLSILTNNQIYNIYYIRDEKWEREALKNALAFLNLLERNEAPNIEVYNEINGDELINFC